MEVARNERQLEEALARYGQAHLLEGVDELAPQVRERFLARLAEVVWDELGEPPEPPSLEDVEPARVVTLDERRKRASELAATGETAYRAGRIAVLMVAGGQGTRLGFPGPKGCFPIGAVSRKSIYQLQAEKVLSLSSRIGQEVPFLVMTSPMTDAETREFFAAHDSFGLAQGQLRPFVQGTVPSLDRTGRALLEEPGILLESPDGHGGSFTALAASGELDRLRREGVSEIVYIQVDNVFARVDDPVLVGLAVSERADVVSKVLAKRDPDEKVGHLVRIGGRDRIVEYTELSPEQVRTRAPDGTPVYRWGSPALHCWSVTFFTQLLERGYRLPLHRSAKPLRAWSGGSVQEVEGWKYERFVFDLVSEADRSVGLEIEREAEFAPVKNAEGDDSPDTARALAHRQYVQWLRAAGVRVTAPPEARVEISPLLGTTREQFIERWDGRVSEVRGDCYLDGAGRTG
jgi:UDP-N-acetylglucosamine/UDP-N-acetylgalactosamine diphosphorylase